MRDVLDYCVMAPSSLGLGFGRDTHSWEGVCFDYLSLDKWTRAKDPTASRWDRKLYDNFWVRDWITELVDTDPKPDARSFKKNVQNYAEADGTLMDGIRMFPRWIVDDTHPFLIATRTMKAISGHWEYKNCATDKKLHLLSDIIHTLSGPFHLDHGGDVGLQPTLIHQYEWSNWGVRMLEENWYALHYGWVSWQLLQWDSLRQVFLPTGRRSIHNKLVKMTVPTINFPCKF